MDDAAGFEAAAKQSWQSFSTLRRFVSEAGRLENASWRLWHMQRLSPSGANNLRKSSSTGSLAATTVTTAAAAGSLEPHEAPSCVYCELHAAHLSCNGCCHDVYCIACFKLVHKKGHLATHTAVKIKELLMQRSLEQLDADAAVTTATTATSGGGGSEASSSESQPDVEPSESSTSDRAGKPAPVATKTKPWEVQMDMLLQRLMLNSMHTDGDISVHNIDSRDSLGTADSVLSDIVMEEVAPPPLLPPPTSARKGSVAEASEATQGWDGAVEKSNQAVVAAAVLVAGRHQQKRTLSFDGLAVQPSSAGVSLPAAKKSNSSSPTSPAMTPSEPPFPDLPLFPATSTLPRTKSKKKNSVCQNCNGNHITIDCPLLANSSMPGGGGGGGVSSAGVMGVDTVLRKCFTTIHNDNLSNSTHAFLGDEISVRGGGHFSKGQWGPGAGPGAGTTTGGGGRDLSPLLSSFGMNSIAEDLPGDSDADDAMPILLALAVASHGSSKPLSVSERKWDCNTWLISSLATELPQEAYEAVRSTEKTCSDLLAHSHTETRRHALAGWVSLKEPGRRWCRRYLSLYRNGLWEFLDDKDSSRPIGFANLSEGSVHEHQGTTLEFAVKYYRQSSQMSARNECWLQFESEKEAAAWRGQLGVAARLQVDDLFDLAPDVGKDAPECYELGKGRFSVVRRACRKQSSSGSGSNDPTSTPSQQHCALKIIDKNVFWDLVAHETERDDTLVREILTQSVLTVRSVTQYCPVIRLLSLFETRSLLVLELELMQEGDLHEEIVTNSAIDELRAPYLVASLVKAIEYCLQNGIAHRDVKLSNLALDYCKCSKGRRYSVIKMADFGMAAFIESDGRLKGRCGTPGFVAPEILTAGKGESYPSGVDMFSVGVVTYTMLCGYEPFFGVNDEELIQMNKSVEYEFEEPEWENISDEAKDLISLMMEKDTAKRITPQEALKHPFLHDASVQLDAILQPEAQVCGVRLL